VAHVHRFTFVVQIHPGGISTLENLSTHERVQIADLTAIGPQIEHWLHRLTQQEDPNEATSAIERRD
jgi:hypothetical protein